MKYKAGDLVFYEHYTGEKTPVLLLEKIKKKVNYQCEMWKVLQNGEFIVRKERWMIPISLVE